LLSVSIYKYYDCQCTKLSLISRSSLCFWCRSKGNEARAREYKKYWADGHERCFEWDKILDQFLASGKKLARVEVLGKSAYYVRQQLNRRIAKRGLGAKSCTGCGVVYLQGN